MSNWAYCEDCDMLFNIGDDEGLECPVCSDQLEIHDPPDPDANYYYTTLH